MTSTEYNPNCPECKGSLIYDYNKGEIVCQNCGQVLELIDHYGPESNTFDNNCNKINETENDELNAKLAYQDIGGLNEVLQKVKEIIELPLTEPQLLKKLGIEPPKGILLFGPPGTGKTLLAKAIPNETSTGFYSIDAPTLITKGNYGEPEEKLREIFQQAKENAPSIIFIDEVDSIAANREITATNHPIHRVVSQLLTLMDGMSSRGQVIVIGSTNRPDAIDPAFRRTGRFDREIEIKAPDSKGRLDILRIHTRKMQLAQDVSLEKIADMCYGFVGADLQGLANEAGMHAVARQKLSVDKDNYVNMNVNNNINYSSKRKNIKIDDMIITMEDFMNAVKTIKPSAMRQITTVQTSDVRLEDVGIPENIKQEVRESIEWPLRFPELFKAAGITPPKGILIHGLSGTGKTLLAKAIANEYKTNFISIKGAELIEKWIGESEKAIRQVFAKAKEVSPYY